MNVWCFNERLLTQPGLQRHPFSELALQKSFGEKDIAESGIKLLKKISCKQ
jgi:hypothetical protein